jgi:hypothetical protein
MAGVDLFQHLTRSIDIFLLGTHSRLGQESHISLLVPDVLQLVCQYVMRPAMLMQCNEMVVTCYQEDKTRVQEGVESLGQFQLAKNRSIPHNWDTEKIQYELTFVPKSLPCFWLYSWYDYSLALSSDGEWVWRWPGDETGCSFFADFARELHYPYEADDDDDDSPIDILCKHNVFDDDEEHDWCRLNGDLYVTATFQLSGYYSTLLQHRQDGIYPHEFATNLTLDMFYDWMSDVEEVLHARRIEERENEEGEKIISLVNQTSLRKRKPQKQRTLRDYFTFPQLKAKRKLRQRLMDEFVVPAKTKDGCC